MQRRHSVLDSAARHRLARLSWRSIPRWLGELVIVFVGVYAAFALSEYQREREVEARRDQLRLALIEEIEDITYNTRNVSFETANMRAQYDSLHAAGEMPPLHPFLEALRVETHMWDAALASGALDLLDVPTMYRMSRFYNQLNGSFERYGQLRQLSESMIVPHAERGTEAFYDPQTRRLRPQYGWYLQGIARLQDAALSTTELGERLIRELEQHTSPGMRGAYAALEAEARQEADTFLQLLDRREARQSWEVLAPALQRNLPLERWEQVMKPRHERGAVEGRVIKHLRFEPDKLEGHDYVSLQYETRPAAGRPMLETLSLIREPGGPWKVRRYSAN